MRPLAAGIPTRRTRVLTVTDSLAVGGAERVAVDIANTLDRSRFEVAFCATRNSGPLVDALADDVPITVLNRRTTWDMSKLVEFASLVRKGDFDLIHSHGRTTMKFVALARATRLIRIPHVFHDHFGLVLVDNGAPLGLRVAMRAGVDAYVGVDDRLCDWARSVAGLPATKAHLIRSGVDLSRFEDVASFDIRSAFDLPTGSVVVAMVANFRRQKDHPTLFHALAELPDQQRDQLRVLLVGSTDIEPAYFDECTSLIDQLHLSKQVRIVGAREDVPALLRGADAGLLSSQSESGPLVLLEYMAAGLPFVATATGEIAKSVRGLGVGICVTPGNHREMARALSRLLELGPEGRKDAGARARATVTEHFSQQAVTRQVQELYAQVLGVNRSDSQGQCS